MDISAFRELRIAPRAVFDGLDARRHRPRFIVPKPGAVLEPGETLSGDVVTWGQFADQIRDIALGLSTLGVMDGDRVAILAPNSVEWGAASLAIQARGAALVPIYPSSTADDIEYVLGHCDATAVFVATSGLVNKVLERRAALPAPIHVIWLGHDAAPAGTISLRDVRARGAAVEAADPGVFDEVMDGVSLDQVGLMLYTSGTSGRPKGVPLTHRNVAMNGLDWLECNAPLLHEGAVDLLWLPMSHIFGFGEMCLGNTLGFTTWMCTPLDIFRFLPVVRPTVFMSVPSVWEKLATLAAAKPTPEARKAELDALTGGRFTFCLSGGAGLKVEVKQFFKECGILIIEGYGLTESSPTLTLNRPDAFRFDSVGRPLPSVELRLAEDGEILARGPNVFSGYHKDPAATAEAFTDDGWLKTGDIGRFTEDGFLQIVDRKKDILVTAGGKNVPPANIEIRFKDDPVFLHVVVYGDGRKYLVAGIWLDAAQAESAREEGAHPNIESLVKARLDGVNAQLASYETIKRFAIMDRPLTIDNALLTPTLKVKRKAVYAAFKAEFEALYEPESSR
ncbi:MAG: long-chain fatty acid--CoA ligase [Myxococcales bacterium]|nr:long-chain fatty acid--CoA ligase [Myxococcales bacterium]